MIWLLFNRNLDSSYCFFKVVRILKNISFVFRKLVKHPSSNFASRCGRLCCGKVASWRVPLRSRSTNEHKTHVCVYTQTHVSMCTHRHLCLCVHTDTWVCVYTHGTTPRRSYSHPTKHQKEIRSTISHMSDSDMYEISFWFLFWAFFVLIALWG